jgi:hypothetical protein
MSYWAFACNSWSLPLYEKQKESVALQTKTKDGHIARFRLLLRNGRQVHAAPIQPTCPSAQPRRTNSARVADAPPCGRALTAGD